MKSNLLSTAYELFSHYATWLKTIDLSEHEVRAQNCRINHFLVFLGTVFSGEENIFINSYRRDSALREYKNYLRYTLKSPATSTEAALVSVDRFFQFVGLPPTSVQADPPERLKALTDDQVTQFLYACRVRHSAREKALMALMLHAGLLPQELAMLDLNDVKMSTTVGFAILGSGETRYKLMLNTECRMAIREYLEERADHYPFVERPAFFLDERGGRLTVSGVDSCVRQIARSVGMDLTARSLQQTYQYHEARRQNKALLAAELLAGTVQV